MASAVSVGAWKYVRILNQEIATAEGLECEGLLWVMRIPGLAGRALYTLSHLGAGVLVFLGIAVPSHLLRAPDLVTFPAAFALGAWAIAYRLRHHPIASKYSVTGIARG